MSIVFGTHLYGLVDRVPAVCHVRTTFAHFMFFPFVPVQTFLIVEGRAGEADRAHPISKSLKSVIFGAVRAFLLLGFLVATSVPLDRLLQDRPGARKTLNDAEMICGLVGLGFLGLFLASYPLSRPGGARRAYLLKLAKVARERELREQTSEATGRVPESSPGAEPIDPEEPPWHRGRSVRD